MPREYVTFKLDKRVANAYAAKHAQSASLLTWRQALGELIIREAGLYGKPLPELSGSAKAAVTEQAKPITPDVPHYTHLDNPLHQWTRETSSEDKYYDQMKQLWVTWKEAQPEDHQSWDYFLVDMNLGKVPYDIVK